MLEVKSYPREEIVRAPDRVHCRVPNEDMTGGSNIETIFHENLVTVFNAKGKLGVNSELIHRG
jgi:hypothetical protein